jgi:transposase
MLFVGVDWAEEHHEVCVMDEAGRVLAKRRVRHSVRGVSELYELVAEFSGEDEVVGVGIEIDRGLLVSALVGAGYEVYAINPKAASRYRDRHGVSGAKSDAGDAKVLADLVRTDRHNHRVVGGDSELVDAIRVLARSHQSAVWNRQRQVNTLRSGLREFYPGASKPSGPIWLRVTPWPCWPSHPRPSSDVPCLARRSRRRCAEEGAPATSR